MAAEAKVCGLTRPLDAGQAAAAGATYLGVVFAGGPRRVSFTKAVDIVAASQGVPVLGVFADQSVAEILALARGESLRVALPARRVLRLLNRGSRPESSDPAQLGNWGPWEVCADLLSINTNE